VSMTAAYVLYAILAMGAAGLFLLLPSSGWPGTSKRRAGAVLAAAFLAAIAVCWTRGMDANFDGSTFFVVFAIVAVVSAARVVTHRRPVYSALYFVLVLLAVTGLCVLAAAEFLAAALVIIYGGAILVTYVFVIMLAQQSGESPYDRQAREPLIAVVLGFALVAAVTQAMVKTDSKALPAARGNMSDAQDTVTSDTVATPAQTGNVRAVGETLMTTYVVAVEVAGVLLLVAMVGAVAIVRKRIEPEALTPAERVPPHEDLGRRGREAAPF